MKFLDAEMTPEETQAYEEHVRTCEDCRNEMKGMGRIVSLTRELRLRPPDEEFWNSYWESIFRRLERGMGFTLMIIGLIALLLAAIYKAVTSPEFLTFRGIALAVALLGLVILFLSVLRERIIESKDDPYKEVKQ
jgi:predicted anti-sigma-YlaC factor YlaD